MQKNENRRLFIFVIFLSILLVPVIIQLSMIMLFESDQAGRKPGESVSGLRAVERGPILDRNGKILAMETKLKSVTAWMPDIVDIDGSAALIAEACGMTKDAILRIFRSTSGFAYIKRKVPPEESDAIERLKKERGLSGINLEDERARVYPNGTIASHLIGYVDIDERGLDGIELTLQDELAPKPGSEGTRIDPAGNQVFLTIDVNLQYAVEKILEHAKEENEADSCIAIIMKAKTGEIIGYCSVPYFNPNDIAHSTSEERINHITIEAYEPGSVFKVFSVSGFLELGGVSMESEFHCNTVYDKVSEPIKCQSAHGDVTPLEVIKYSCNVGAAYASETVDKARFHKFLTDSGFGSKTGIELPGETAGILRPASRWSGRTKPAISFGQEISVSALQIVQAATALANGGIMLKPMVIRKIVSPAGRLIREYNRVPVREVLSPRTALLMLQMMESTTVGNGTARLAAVEGVRVSAKTGTAQVYDPKTKRYSEKDYTPSILGIFPTEDPEYIVYAVIKNPKKGSYYGSRIAAPLFREIAEAVIAQLHLPTSDSTVIRHPTEIMIRNPEKIVLEDTMPDLSGVPKRQLLPLFQREDITITIRGEGYVVRQRPLPGSPITEGMHIILELE